MGSLARWIWLFPLLMTSADVALRWHRIARGTGLSPTYRRLLAGRWLVFALPCLIFGAGLGSGGAEPSNYFHAPSAWPVEALFLSILVLASGVAVWVTHRGGASLLVTHPGVITLTTTTGVIFRANMVLAIMSAGLWGRLWQAWAPPTGLALAAANLAVLAYDCSPHQVGLNPTAPELSPDEVQRALRRGKTAGLLLLGGVIAGVIVSVPLSLLSAGPSGAPGSSLFRAIGAGAQMLAPQASSSADSAGQTGEGYRQAVRQAAAEGRWDDGAAAVIALDRLTMVRSPEVEALLAGEPQLQAALEQRQHATPWQDPLSEAGAIRTEWLINDLAFSPDGRRLLVATGAGSAGNVEVWDLATLQRERLLTAWHNVGLGPYGLSAYTLDVRPDSASFVSAHTSARDQPRTIAIWSLDDDAPRLTLPGTLARFSPDGRQLAGANAHGRLTLWRADTGEVLATPGPLGAEVVDLAWGEGGATLVVADERGRVALWELPAFQAPRPLAAEGDTIATSADGALVAVAGGGALTVVSLKTNTMVMQAVTAGAVVDLAFSPDGRLIATAANIQREVVPGGYQDEGVFEV